MSPLRHFSSQNRVESMIGPPSGGGPMKVPCVLTDWLVPQICWCRASVRSRNWRPKWRRCWPWCRRWTRPASWATTWASATWARAVWVATCRRTRCPCPTWASAATWRWATWAAWPTTVRRRSRWRRPVRWRPCGRIRPNCSATPTARWWPTVWSTAATNRARPAPVSTPTPRPTRPRRWATASSEIPSLFPSFSRVSLCSSRLLLSPPPLASSSRLLLSLLLSLLLPICGYHFISLCRVSKLGRGVGGWAGTRGMEDE